MKRIAGMAAGLAAGLMLMADASAMYVVNAGTLNVRSGPGTSYGIIGQLSRGTQVHVVSVSGSWSKIDAPKTGWVASLYLTKVATTTPTPAPSPNPAITNLNMTYYRQHLGYGCGPTTGEMVVLYITGRWYSEETYANVMGSNIPVGSGTSAAEVVKGINHFSGGQTYTLVKGFSRPRTIANINRNMPVPININCRYLAYRGYVTSLHHSPIKGYTSAGFYIHDTNGRFGPNRWASTTEVSNAVNYHYGLYSVRY